MQVLSFQKDSNNLLSFYCFLFFLGLALGQKLEECCLLGRGKDQPHEDWQRSAPMCSRHHRVAGKCQTPQLDALMTGCTSLKDLDWAVGDLLSDNG